MFLIVYSKLYLVIIFNSIVISLDALNSSIENSTLLISDGTEKLKINGCYQIENKTYKLVWNDDFDNPQTLNREWLLEHWNMEENYCAGRASFIYPHIDGLETSCMVEQNVVIRDGFLVLAAKYENNSDSNYTAAQMKSKRYFNRGRYEIRAAQPIGRSIRTCMQAINTDDPYWHESGQIDMMCVKSSTEIYRGLYLANSSDNTNIRVNGEIYNNIHKFHLYGVEWDEAQLRFFFDDIYSKPVWFDQAKGRGLNPWKQLRLQIGVGGIHFKSQPSDFAQLYWKCPAFVIDYIRIFENYENLNNENNSCTHYDPLNYQMANETLKHKNVCKDILDSSNNPEDNKAKRPYLIPMLVALVVVIFLVLILFLLIQNKKLRREILRNRNWILKFHNNYYNKPDFKEKFLPKAEPYLELQDVVPKTDPYLELQDVLPKTDQYLELQDVLPKTDPYLDMQDVVAKTDPYLDMQDVVAKTDPYLELQDATLSEYMDMKKSDKNIKKYDPNDKNNEYVEQNE